MAPIEKYLRNHIPAAIKSIAVPFLTLLIMLPLTFCLIGPAASLLGTYFSKVLSGSMKHLVSLVLVY